MGGMTMSTDKWKKENTKVCSVRLVKRGVLFLALQDAITEKNMTDSQYIRAALTEKLIRDGYLQEGAEK